MENIYNRGNYSEKQYQGLYGRGKYRVGELYGERKCMMGKDI